MALKTVATILHVSDLHLFVDGEKGALGPAKAKRAFASIALGLRPQAKTIEETEGFFWKNSSILAGAYHHDPDYLFEFRDKLDELVKQNARENLIVVQTGDVEAYGGRRWPFESKKVTFPGFEWWKVRRQAALGAGAKHVLDLFGNHDVWPGTLPPFGLHRIDETEQALRSLPEFSAPMPDCHRLDLGGCYLELYRVNSVLSGFVENLFAKGRLDPDYPLRGANYPGSETPLPERELEHLLDQSPTDKPSIRVLALHHPPHVFAGRGTSKKTWEGQLECSEAVEDLFGRGRFHVVLSGHRHLIDPFGAPLDAKGPPQQPPLPAHSVQLVAASPTVPTDPRGENPSFSLYRFKVNTSAAPPTLRVERVLYEVNSADAVVEFAKSQDRRIVDVTL